MVDMYDKSEEEEVVAEDDLPPDDVELDEAEGNLKDKIADLRKKLKASEEEKRNSLEELQRARADFLNSRRRLEEQLLRDKERAGDKILVELLTLADSFDTAMADEALWQSIDERWRTGIEAIHSKLSSILAQNGVEATNPQGAPFNPEEHEAVGNVAVTDDAQVDTVVSVLQKGFVRNGTVIRPARVVVGTK